ncbi:MAG: alpha-amylase [Armatimonadetes bacterium]|nr:alpha-amylase [Armatimonadota bacterium]
MYNLFVRLATSFDHNNDGIIGGNSNDITLNKEFIRETGTFLKSIALLGHLKKIGINTLYLLPITSIGKDGNKGELGSPYAIKNPYKIDSKLKDPLLDTSLETEFKAFMEACHIFGIKVILEFVFRTASKDADWILEHPDWFYWIKENIPDRILGEADFEKIKLSYGNPYFPKEELHKIKQKVEANDLINLPAPLLEYQKMFALPPKPENITLQNDRYIARTLDPETHKKIKVKIPGAFADWPPDDTQPPWTDVTYLRMYIEKENPKFNYMAYNTIRMYDQNLAKTENANFPLWEKIKRVIPYYQEEFQIDGVMIDMGHAMPSSLMRNIIESAREKNPQFLFLSENFSIDETSLKQGYNAVMGYSCFVEHEYDGFKKILRHCIEGMPLPFLASPENHNTPRSAQKEGGINFSKINYLFNCFIPNALPFIHNGYELGETYPVNTGLCFSKEELAYFQDKKLPLFDIFGFSWNKNELTDYIEKISRIRRKYKDLIVNNSKESIEFLETHNHKVLGFIRKDNRLKLYILLNLNYQGEEKFFLNLNEISLKDEIYEKKYSLKNYFLEDTLDIGEGLILVKD